MTPKFKCKRCTGSIELTQVQKNKFILGLLAHPKLCRCCKRILNSFLTNVEPKETNCSDVDRRTSDIRKQIERLLKEGLPCISVAYIMRKFQLSYREAVEIAAHFGEHVRGHDCNH